MSGEFKEVRIKKLEALLLKHGVCEDCGDMYSHDIDSPHASCGCKQSEWYEFTPYMDIQSELYTCMLNSAVSLENVGTRQSKIESLLEQSANYTSGFIIAYATWELVAFPMVKAMNSHPLTGLAVISLFTVVSFARSYFWRRFFNAEVHKLVHVFVKQLLRRSK